MTKKPNLPGGPRIGHRALLLATCVGAHVLSPALLLAEVTKASLSLSGLRAEYKENPLGIDVLKPRLSWQLVSSGRGVRQSAYEIRVSRSAAALGAGRDLVWSSGRVASDESTQRVYEGPPLQSGRRYYWQVRAWDGAGTGSAWSTPAYWEMGLLEPSDWKATWIEPDLPEDVKTSGPAPMLRRVFKLNGAIERARAYVTSHGLYELNLNGRRVGDQLFTPGWTSYNKRLQYQTSTSVPAPTASRIRSRARRQGNRRRHAAERPANAVLGVVMS